MNQAEIIWTLLIVVAALAILAKSPAVCVSRRIVAILEGESLVNDATVLVARRFAILAITSGTFSFSEASGRFVLELGEAKFVL